MLEVPRSLANLVPVNNPEFSDPDYGLGRGWSHQYWIPITLEEWVEGLLESRFNASKLKEYAGNIWSRIVQAAQPGQNPSNQLKRELPYVTRRRFCWLVAGTTTGLALAPKPVEAAEITRSHITPWTQANWHPIFAQTARKWDITRLSEGYPGNPLVIYDETFGTEAFTEQVRYESEYVAIHQHDPKEVESAGHCEALALAGLKPDPQEGWKRSLLVVQQVGSPVRPLRNLLEVVWELRAGNVVIVDHPEGRLGSWYRDAYGITADSKQIQVTNWDFGDKLVELTGIKGAWVVEYFHSSLVVDAPNRPILQSDGHNPQISNNKIDELIAAL